MSGRMMRALWRTVLSACIAGASAAGHATQPAAPAPSASQAAMLQRGQAVYERCQACHAIEQNRTGPAHCGLFGRKAGSAPGFEGYSAAMRQSGWVWTPATLDRFLKAPMQALPGTSMGYAGVQNDEERAALIAWLKLATRPGQACQMPSP